MPGISRESGKTKIILIETYMLLHRRDLASCRICNLDYNSGIAGIFLYYSLINLGKIPGMQNFIDPHSERYLIQSAKKVRSYLL